MPNYIPYEFRRPDGQYGDLLYRIFRYGFRAQGTRQGVDANTLIQGTMQFDLTNGFPVIPDRSIKSFWNRPIGELCAFINGVTTLEGLIEFGCTWWEPWVTPEKCAEFGLQPGDIGESSYGGAMRYFPTREGESFDQFENLVAQILELPNDRVHFVTPWIPSENARSSVAKAKGHRQRNTIAPCHGWVHARILGDEIHLHMFQRSGDTPVGVPSNMVQYAALALMLEQLTGFAARAYYHTISDTHIYANQFENVKELISRPPLRLPTVKLTIEGRRIRDIHDFRREHFEMSDYQPHPAMKDIPVAT